MEKEMATARRIRHRFCPISRRRRTPPARLAAILHRRPRSLPKIFSHHVAPPAGAGGLGWIRIIGLARRRSPRVCLAEPKGDSGFARVYSDAGTVFHSFHPGYAPADAVQPRAPVTPRDDIAARLEPVATPRPVSIYRARSLAMDRFARAASAPPAAGFVKPPSASAIGTGASVSFPGVVVDVRPATTKRIVSLCNVMFS